MQISPPELLASMTYPEGIISMEIAPQFLILYLDALVLCAAEENTSSLGKFSHVIVM